MSGHGARPCRPGRGLNYHAAFSLPTRPRVKIAAFVPLALLFSIAARADTVELANPGFEMPSTEGDPLPGWTAQQHAGEPAYEFAIDTRTFAKGKQAFRLTRLTPEEYAVLEQRIQLPKIAGQDLVFTALVKTKDVGPKGFTLCLNFISGDGGIMQQVMSTPLKGTQPKWTPVKVSAKVPNGAFFVEAGFVLLDGGAIWADEASLKTAGAKPEDPKKAAADARKAAEAKKPDPAKKSPKSADGAKTPKT